jgi:hypothetical protein
VPGREIAIMLFHHILPEGGSEVPAKKKAAKKKVAKKKVAKRKAR